MTEKVHNPVVMVAGMVDGVYPRPVAPADLIEALDFLENGDYHSALLTMAVGFDEDGEIITIETPWGKTDTIAFQFRNRLYKDRIGTFTVTERYMFKAVGTVEGRPHYVVEQMANDAAFRGSLIITCLNERHDAVKSMTIALETPETMLDLGEV